MAKTLYGSTASGKIKVTAETGAVVYVQNEKGKRKDAAEDNGTWLFKGLGKGSWTVYVEKDGLTWTKEVAVEGSDTYAVEIICRRIPEFTYSGSYQVVDDNDNVISDLAAWRGNWKIRFLTSGSFKITKLFGAVKGIDVFLVGGGGNGFNNTISSGGRGGGGGGGYTRTIKAITLSVGTAYTITVGGTRGDSSAFGYTASKGGNYKGNNGGGNGGSGGGTNNKTGGTDGYDGPYYDSDYGIGYGQRSHPGPNGETGTTREFAESGGTLYSTGGSGKSSNPSSAAPANTGDGGHGSRNNSSYNSGASGIVIIRNTR